MNAQQEHKDQQHQPPFKFIEAVPSASQAEELLASLRQCFLSSPGKLNPMRVLALIEDLYPATEKDCDFLRLSLQMAKDMGTGRVLSMRMHHYERIAQMIQRTLPEGILNS